MAKNFDKFEVEAQDGGWAQFSTPPPPHHIMHRSSNARTVPTSSHGSSYSASVRSSESSLEPPPEQQDDSVSGAGKDIVGGWTQTKTLMVVTTLLLLFGAGILGGLMATGGLSRSNNAISSVDNGNATSGAAPTDVVIEIFDEPTATPVDADAGTPINPPPVEKPTIKPTMAPTDNGWVDLPAPAEPLTFPDGRYNYRANSDFLVGTYVPHCFTPVTRFESHQSLTTVFFFQLLLSMA